eukprot:CAMPEP_0197033142 /NCGR_PEP_ID=MMETSP1384-20130603/11632_1 /TAXON_ID=29189 /ORGANISM="Ammonia sp." /LENGTH=506 /DNA_ID=CAMNT_0042462911 /DNA_START=15 /DNA_END=1532 /DNA_ORIENTATION=+
MVGPTKPCRGKHNFFKQVRMRDASLAWDADDLQVMFFGNDISKFPQCNESDLIRIHRLELNFRAEPVNAFQGVVKLDKKFICFVVFDGNLTMPNNRECVRHSVSEQYSFDDVVDAYFIKYLKAACRQRQERINPDLVRMAESDIKAVPNVLGVNQNVAVYLNEIQADYDRVNLVVMLIGRLDDEEEHAKQANDADADDVDDDDLDVDSMRLQFYWIVWDGSYCGEQADLFELHEMHRIRHVVDDEMKQTVNDNDEEEEELMEVDEAEDAGMNESEWDTEMMYNDAKIIGSAVKMLVCPEYELAVQCYNDIAIGDWVQLINVKVDRQRKQLVYDEHSKIYSKIQVSSNKFVQQRLHFVHYRIQQNTDVITHISSMVPHHQYQAFTPIAIIAKSNEVECKYRVRGKCVGYHPYNIQKFSRQIPRESGKEHVHECEYEIVFVLVIRDSSDAAMNVIFEGDEAKRFFGIERAEDLSKAESEQLQEIGHCMQVVMNEKSMMEVCVRSFQPK